MNVKGDRDAEGVVTINFRRFQLVVGGLVAGLTIVGMMALPVRWYVERVVDDRIDFRLSAAAKATDKAGDSLRAEHLTFVTKEVYAANQREILDRLGKLESGQHDIYKLLLEMRRRD